MTIEQMLAFIAVAQEGIRQGLGTPYEWYIMWRFKDGNTDMIRYREITRAFAEFFRGCVTEEDQDHICCLEDHEVINRYKRFS